jgi:hypothetical protein
MNCGDTFKSPPLQAEAAIPVVMAGPKDYHWSEFLGQNTQVKELVQKSFPTVMFMDVYNATVVRADLHPSLKGDCLHYCTPGPIDDWTLFLFNILRLAKHDKRGTPNDPFRHHKDTIDEDRIGTVQYAIPIIKEKVKEFEGKLVMSGRNSAVYIVKNYTRHVFASAVEFGSFGYEFSDVHDIGSNDLYHIPVGRPVAEFL